MADEKSSSTILVVVVIGLVLYLLISKATTAVKNVNASVKQTYTTGTAAAALATSVAPALGQFLSNVGRPSSGPSSSGMTSSSGSFSGTGLPPIGSGFSGSGDDLAPAYADNSTSAAFSDDTSNDYLLA